MVTVAAVFTPVRSGLPWESSLACSMISLWVWYHWVFPLRRFLLLDLQDQSRLLDQACSLKRDADACSYISAAVHYVAMRPFSAFPVVAAPCPSIQQGERPEYAPDGLSVTHRAYFSISTIPKEAI